MSELERFLVILVRRLENTAHLAGALGRSELAAYCSQALADAKAEIAAECSSHHEVKK
jgi:hypothetical protein